jgi:hypothetical protein
LKSLFRKPWRFWKKWNDIKIVLEYGMLSETNSMKNQLLSFYIHSWRQVYTLED